MTKTMNGHKIARKLTMEQAENICHALVGVHDVVAGKDMPEKYLFMQSILLQTPDLRKWLEAVDMVDKANVAKIGRAKLAGVEPHDLRRTTSDNFTAAVFAFLTYPSGIPIVWDGVSKALAIVTSTAPPDQPPVSAVVASTEGGQ